MKSKLTELVFILDKSGSMGGMETDTIGGFNSMLEKQRKEDGDCRISTILFDNNYEILHDRIDIKAVRNITEKEYFVGGSTALLDAIGRTINKIINVQKGTDEKYRADKVLFVIITDGEENASREYTAEYVKKKIEYQTREHGWEFVFLAADIDAVQTAANFGIRADRAQNFHKDKRGMNLNFEILSNSISDLRKNSELSPDWKKKIEDDYKNRKKGK